MSVSADERCALERGCTYSDVVEFWLNPTMVCSNNNFLLKRVVWGHPFSMYATIVRGEGSQFI